MKMTKFSTHIESAEAIHDYERRIGNDYERHMSSMSVRKAYILYDQRALLLQQKKNFARVETNESEADYANDDMSVTLGNKSESERKRREEKGVAKNIERIFFFVFERQKAGKKERKTRSEYSN